MPPKKDNNSSSSSSIANINNNNNNNNTMHNSSSALPTTNANTTTPATDLAVEQRQQLYVANAKLCRMVRKSPWLYDRNNSNYGKKQTLDKTWAKIAKDCNDSVASCKERWRNIRAAFARSINIYKTHGGPNRVKPYYLHKELNFLVKPMMDGRDKFKIDDDEDTKEELDEDNGEDDEADGDEYDDDENDGNSTAEHDENEDGIEPETDMTEVTEGDFNFPNEAQQITSAKAPLPPNTVNCKRLAESAVSLESKILKLNSNSESSHISPLSATTPVDADARFLETVLPDMRAMNARQKIIFKRKVYQSLEEVFETSTDFPHAATSQSSQSFVAFNGMQNAGSPAQALIDSIASLSESELLRLRALKQSQSQSALSNRNPMQNGPVATSTPCAKTLTVIPRASKNRNQNNQTPRNAKAAGATQWELLVPITVKDEIDDVDID